MLEVWTDGSSGKDKSGGWAAIVVRDEQELVRFDGFELDTTNNRMELASVIQGVMAGLSYISGDEKLIVRSDSAYVVNCFKDKWYVKWLANNWTASGGTQVKNREMWETLIKIAMANEDKIVWTHVKGHVGDHWNEVADTLAHAARMKAVAKLKEANS